MPIDTASVTTVSNPYTYTVLGTYYERTSIHRKMQRLESRRELQSRKRRFNNPIATEVGKKLS